MPEVICFSCKTPNCNFTYNCVSWSFFQTCSYWSVIGMFSWL